MFPFNRLKTPLLLAFCSLVVQQVNAQILFDAYFPEKNTGTIALSYTAKSYDQFYRGETLADGNPAGLGTISSDVYSIYAQYALTDWLVAVANLPFIKVENDSEAVDPILMTNEVSALQDLGVFLKARALEAKVGEEGAFVLGFGAGVALPISDYEPGSILSVGNQATALEGSILLQYRLGNGLFVEAIPGFSFRSDDVPNAFVCMAKLGYAHSKFYVDVILGNQNSTDGIDIGGEGFMGPPDLPKTQVNYNVLDANLYVPVAAGFGVSVGGGLVLGGRNVGQEQYFKAGLVYNFQPAQN